MNYPISDFERVLSKKYNGGGVIDSLIKPFTSERYTGERHAYSLAPSTFLKPMQFIGPRTNLDEEAMTPIAGKLIKTKNFSKKQGHHQPKHLRDSEKIQPTN